MCQLHDLKFSRLGCVAPGKYKYDSIDLNIIKYCIKDSCLNCLEPELFSKIKQVGIKRRVRRGCRGGGKEEDKVLGG